ncbi:ATP-dependent Clp protease proteolytic subunit [Flavobacterium sp. Fl-318]|uniref:ATP-dependent Clp protease proteolytic subunit n=1 Tax=Flavobacterium cupriresistens TaxID=2893885 RepID=A0ABU4RG77_9FLAO|nr:MULTISPECIES: head maturation protease, ClpP-related [unclassified Flavobacterium]MDX6191585.1 ATP-dependent Clp protease proteolytic subunit [Flavobacterium sp. Fl-318]UFH41532.1 ATP-dependent Clp protease proteolytic subunit [Flavobacterium sp. F-323]
MNEILMYGEIGFDITDSQFIKELDQFKGQEVKIRANSPGGEVFQGWAMYNAIKEHGQCDMQIDGLAASMMTVIMLACRKISASRNAMIMIHNPSSGGGGDSKRLKKDAELLDKVKNLIVTSYSERTGISENEISVMLDAETWLTAEEALEKGFIDEITDEVLQSTEPNNLKNKKPKAVYMSFKKEAPKKQSLTAILGLQANAEAETVLKAISALKNTNTSLEAENKRIKAQIKQEQKEEAKKITAIAIEKGVINKNLERIQLMAFDADFKKAKEDLLNAISEVDGSSVQMENHRLIRSVILGSKTATDEVKTAKPKSEWTLQDYRKNAPKELENDRDLYNKLVKQEYKH